MAAEGVDGGILVCSGSFTQEAKNFANSKPLELVGGPELARLIRNVQAVPKIDTNASEPRCPRCGSEMILRTAKKGAAAGSRFWGCAEFPKCRGTKDFIAEP